MGGGQGTGGSTSIRAFYTALRQVGASARAMLVQAAAAQWQVDPASLRTENGEVIDDANKRRLGYGALAPAAAKLPAPQNPDAQGRQGFQADRQVGQAVGHAGQGQWQGAVRHRCAHAGPQGRHPDGVARGGRQGCGRGSGCGAQSAGRASGGGAGRSGRGGGRSFLGGAPRPGCAGAALERWRQRQAQFPSDHGRAGSCRRKRCRRQERRRCRQGPDAGCACRCRLSGAVPGACADGAA